MNRTPRSECRVTIAQAYEGRHESMSCCNPTFFHEPVGSSNDTIRLTARQPDGLDEDAGPQGR